MNYRRLLTWLCAAGISARACGGPPETRFHYTRTEMAVPIKLTFYDVDAAHATRAAEAVFQRFAQINRSMSDFDPDSELSRLSATAGSGRAVPVSAELWTVLACAQQVAQRSDGAFDVTIGPLVRLWRRARRQKQLPSPERIQAARQLVGFRLMRLDPQRRTVELLRPGMLLDLGGIAKGYAADQGLAVLRGFGIRRALVYAGGDIGLGEPPPDRPGWTVAVGLTSPQGPPAQTLLVSRSAVSTSGDMWQFVVLDGRRYSHIVDPKTGMGLTDRATVTVVGPQGMLTDAMSKVVAVLGPGRGFPLIDQTPGMAAMVARLEDGKTRIYKSVRWQFENKADGR
jgi:thiamine biosynthesis lipoprotein